MASSICTIRFGTTSYIMVQSTKEIITDNKTLLKQTKSSINNEVKRKNGLKKKDQNKKKKHLEISLYHYLE